MVSRSQPCRYSPQDSFKDLVDVVVVILVIVVVVVVVILVCVYHSSCLVDVVCC